MNVNFSDTNDYIAQFPDATQQQLQTLRACILKAAPKATEKISYGMPAFYLHEVLVYMAGYKNHIGFYPHSEPIVFFKEELKKYKTSKGAIQFPIDEKLPLALITKIVKHRLKQATEKAELKKAKTTKKK
jgi:uncharacterized protein YdhG (YjbR/CyaY superfamily)